MTTRFAATALLIVSVTALVAPITQVSCYTSKTLVTRSDLFQSVVLTVTSSSSLVAAAAVAAPPPANAVLSSGFCAQGVGEGCEDRSEGNEFIKSLQEKSAANREANSREALNAFYMKNYPDYFQSTGRNLVKKPDGTFVVFSDSEMEKLRKENKLAVEIPKAKGGKYTDVTQGRIVVLKDEE